MTNSYSGFVAQKAKLDSAKQAAVRCAPMWLLHMFTIPPVVSAIYCGKTNNWIPFLSATGAAIVSLPLAFIDLGVTFFVAPPVTSAVLLTTTATRKRTELGILDPAQADGIVHEITYGKVEPPAVPVAPNGGVPVTTGGAQV